MSQQMTGAIETIWFEVPAELGDDLKLMSIWSEAIKKFPSMKAYEFEAALRWFGSFAEAKLSDAKARDRSGESRP